MISLFRPAKIGICAKKKGKAPAWVALCAPVAESVRRDARDAPRLLSAATDCRSRGVRWTSAHLGTICGWTPTVRCRMSVVGPVQSTQPSRRNSRRVFHLTSEGRFVMICRKLTGTPWKGMANDGRRNRRFREMDRQRCTRKDASRGKRLTASLRTGRTKPILAEEGSVVIMD